MGESPEMESNTLAKSTDYSHMGLPFLVFAGWKTNKTSLLSNMLPFWTGVFSVNRICPGHPNIDKLKSNLLFLGTSNVTLVLLYLDLGKK